MVECVLVGHVVTGSNYSLEQECAWTAGAKNPVHTAGEFNKGVF